MPERPAYKNIVVLLLFPFGHRLSLGDLFCYLFGGCLFPGFHDSWLYLTPLKTNGVVAKRYTQQFWKLLRFASCGFESRPPQLGTGGGLYVIL